MMNRKAMLAAGLIAGAAALTGCTANTTLMPTPTPQAAQKTTAKPAETAMQAEASPSAAENDDTGLLALRVSGKEMDVQAMAEENALMLPLIETGEALGWKADSEETEEETQKKRVITLEKGESRITVSYTVSDNTAKGITWQKDGLLIPVDTRITTADGVVYVPAAFFEEAADAVVERADSFVSVEEKAPAQTPETQEQTAGQNG